MENGRQVKVSRLCVGLGKPSYLTAHIRMDKNVYVWWDGGGT